MVNKIIQILLVAAVLVTGTWGFIQLRYWSRSIRIFSYGETENLRASESRGGSYRNGHGESEQSGEPERRESFRDRVLPQDSLKGQIRGDFAPGFWGRPGDGFGRANGYQRGESFRRGGHRGGSTISLGNVFWFLAVFAAFATLTIYLDKLVKYVNVKKTAPQVKSK